LLTPSLRLLVRNWWAVVVWLVIIRLESTDMASATNTTGLLYSVIAAVVPRIDPHLVEQLDDVVRKTGHFLGYGILSALVLLALRNTNRDRLRPLLLRTWGTCLRDLWRREWVFIGVLMTMLTAACDEIHQSFIPSRTGRWQDVVLDTCGAAVIQVGMYFVSLRMLRRRQAIEREPELSSIR